MKKNYFTMPYLKGLMLALMLCIVGNAWADTATSSSLSSKSTAAQTVESGKTITYKCSSSNDYENPARIYTNSTFTISSTDGVTITKIEITSPSGNPATGFEANVGTYSATTTTGTWTGSATSVKFTASAQVRVSAITVTYTSSASTDPAQAAKLPFTFDGKYGDIAKNGGMSQTGISSTDYSASPYLKFDDAGDNLIINYASTARNVTYKIKGNSTTSSAVFDVLESADGKTYTTVHSHTGSTIPSTATSYTDKLNSESRYVKFVYTAKGGNVGLGAITITNEKADAGLAFELSTYRFATDAKDMKVTATSTKGSTGAITYALTTGDNNKFAIDEKTGDIYCETAGTYTVTATIADTEDHKEATSTCTVIIKEPVEANSIIVAEADGKYYAMTNTGKSNNGSDYIESVQIAKVGDKYYAVDLDAIKYCVTTSDGKTTIVNKNNGQYLQSTAAKNVSFTDDKYEWTLDDKTGALSAGIYGTLRYNTGNPRFTTYTSATGQIAQIVSLNDVSTDMCYERATTSGKYGTICLPYAVKEEDIAGADFYTATVNGNAVVLETVTELEAGKPYIFKATESSVIVEMSGDIKDATTNGPLVGVLTATEVPVGKYVLQTQNGVQKFYQVAEGQQPTLSANKAYLTDSASEAKSLSIGLEGTAINALNAITTNTAKIYDISGCELKTLQKGLNIVNGVKVLVK